MTSNAERREQVLWQMVYYLMGIVESTPADNDTASRVSSTLDGFYAQLDDLKSKPCAEVVS